MHAFPSKTLCNSLRVSLAFTVVECNNNTVTITANLPIFVSKIKTIIKKKNYTNHAEKNNKRISDCLRQRYINNLLQH